MQTANLIKVSGAKHPAPLVHYNMKTQKTQGQWQDESQSLKQSDLISFTGIPDQPGSSLDQKASDFVGTAYRNANRGNALGPHRHKNYNLMFTNIQSFDFNANPDLTPQEVHQMGLEYAKCFMKYQYSTYGYKVDSMMISTHIDDDQYQKINLRHGKQRLSYPHLHNHILFPSYNTEGRCISYGLRKRDIYQFQRLNDYVCAEHNLRDYHFGKLYREIHPESIYTLKRAKTGRHLSNLQRAYIRFHRANDTAWDRYPTDFRKAQTYRNQQLTMRYGMKVKIHSRDEKTGKRKFEFTMNDFKNGHGQQQWYNINNLHLLWWRNRERAEKERLLREFDFTGVRDVPIKFSTYSKTVRQTTGKLPPVAKLDSPSQRSRHTINVSRILNHVLEATRREKKQIMAESRKVAFRAREKMKQYYRKAKLKAFDLQLDLSPKLDIDQDDFRLSQVEQHSPTESRSRDGGRQGPQFNPQVSHIDTGPKKPNHGPIEHGPDMQ